FYALLGPWMLAFGRSTAAMLGWMAVLGAALGICIYEIARRECGEMAALACAVMFTSARVVQRSTNTVMADLLVGLLTLAATAAYGWYLESGRRRDAFLFALFAAMAVATNGRGLVVVLVPVLTGWVAPRGKASVAKIVARTCLGLAGVAAVVAMPFVAGESYPLTIGSVTGNSLHYIARAGSTLVWLMPLLAILASVAVVSGRKRNLWTAMAALVAANWIFFSVVNTPFEDRYLITALPAITLLAAKGWRMAWDRSPRYLRVALAALCCAVLGWNTLPAERQTNLGYAHAWEQLPRVDRVSLVAGDAETEGALIAAMALRDRNFEHVVYRATKALSSSRWSGYDYKMKFSSTSQVSDFLEQSGIGTVIFQKSAPAPHTVQLESALREDDRWRELPALFDNARVFQRVVPPPRKPLHFHLENPGGLRMTFDIDEP
ncbi:MAG: hypothetical protein LAO79_23510, partial [Acidobacteriia bacterium]|nr:hypothetical protein [Terriglobia bacterium]